MWQKFRNTTDFTPKSSSGKESLATFFFNCTHLNLGAVNVFKEEKPTAVATINKWGSGGGLLAGS